MLSQLHDPWRADVSQEITSAATSVRIVPRAFRHALFLPGTRNADIGGGRFSDATSYLATIGVENVVFDPFNRSRDHNILAASMLRGGQAATATVANVLNVIACRLARDRVIALAADAIRKNGRAYFQVFEGNRSGVPGPTPKGWQENRPLKTYLSEISVHFGHITVRGGIVEAACPQDAPWVTPDGAWRTLEQANANAGAAMHTGPAYGGTAA